MKRQSDDLDRRTPRSAVEIARFLSRGYVRLLPGRRGAALAGLIRDSVNLVSGHGPLPSHPAGDPPVQPTTLLRARRSLADGDLDTAQAAAGELLGRHPDSVAALEVRREVEVRRGATTAALATIRTMRAVSDTPALERDERMTVGTLLETDPRWTPRIPGPARTVAAPDPDVALVLTGDPARPLGMPQASLEADGSMVALEIEAGAAWTAVASPDEALAIGAWLIARAARDRSPSIVVAGKGGRGYDTLLVGLALRDHLEIPLVVDGAVDGTTEPTSGESSTRTAATIDRCLMQADAVVATDADAADRLTARGVARDRIVIVAPDAGRGRSIAVRAALRAPRSGFPQV